MKELPEVNTSFGDLYRTLYEPVRTKLLLTGIDDGLTHKGTKPRDMTLGMVSTAQMGPDMGLNQGFIAGSLFYYFEESEICRLVSSMAERFPDGEMIFDAVSKVGLWFSNRMVKKTGNTGAKGYFSLGNPVKRISGWSDNIEVAEWYPYWHGIKRDPRWGKNTIFKMNFCDWFKMGKFVQLRFVK